MSIESILGAVLVLAIVIFVHELGHFLVAKWCDVEVLVFSMGFGPTLWSRKYGETEYRLAAVPFGGYVRMAGQDDSEDPPASDPSRGFSAKSIPQRTAIVAAGPAVNVVFAFFVFFVVFWAYGKQEPVEGPRIGGVLAGAPADEAGLKLGDLILSVDGREISRWEELSEIVRASEGKTLELAVRGKDGDVRRVRVTPEPREERDRIGEVIGTVYMIGVSRDFESVEVGPFEAVALAGEYTWGFTSIIFQTLGRLLQGRVSASDLGGPIMIAQEAGRRAATGLDPLLRFLALISVNLGVINVLPIPVLDGGHLAFFLVEAIRGRPLSLRVRELAQQVGVFLLVALMVFVVFNDISRIVGG